jgi:ADP-ribose pyrophosphatase
MAGRKVVTEAPDFQITGRSLLKEKGFFKVLGVNVRHGRFDGGEDLEIFREVPVRPGTGDSVAILAFDPLARKVILNKELRIGVLYAGENPFTYALPAGGINNGETPLVAALREATEEMGVELIKPRLVIDRKYPSEGGVSERISVVFAYVVAPKEKAVLGLEEEHENILRESVPASRFVALRDQGREMVSMTACLAAYWFKENRRKLVNEFKAG